MRGECACIVMPFFLPPFFSLSLCLSGLKVEEKHGGFIEGRISTPFLSSCLMKGRGLLVSMFVSARETRGQEERMVVE